MPSDTPAWALDRAYPLLAYVRPPYGTTHAELVDSVARVLAAAREEGRREGIEQAARLCAAQAVRTEAEHAKDAAEGALYDCMAPAYYIAERKIRALATTHTEEDKP
jgi:hypothetical protein